LLYVALGFLGLDVHPAAMPPGLRAARLARYLPWLNDPLMEALRHLPRHLGTEYVFWNHETATRFVSIKRAWHTALKKAKITGFRFHDLRHTFASHVQMDLGDLRGRAGAPRPWLTPG
jgi:integrase